MLPMRLVRILLTPPGRRDCLGLPLAQHSQMLCLPAVTSARTPQRPLPGPRELQLSVRATGVRLPLFAHARAQLPLFASAAPALRWSALGAGRCALQQRHCLAADSGAPDLQQAGLLEGQQPLPAVRLRCRAIQQEAQTLPLQQLRLSQAASLQHRPASRQHQQQRGPLDPSADGLAPLHRTAAAPPLLRCRPHVVVSVPWTNLQ